MRVKMMLSALLLSSVRACFFFFCILIYGFVSMLEKNFRFRFPLRLFNSLTQFESSESDLSTSKPHPSLWIARLITIISKWLPWHSLLMRWGGVADTLSHFFFGSRLKIRVNCFCLSLAVFPEVGSIERATSTPVQKTAFMRAIFDVTLIP